MAARSGILPSIHSVVASSALAMSAPLPPAARRAPSAATLS